MDKQYLPRIIDKIIEESFEVIRALCIEGIKYCGKTSTCEHIANTVFKFQDIYKKEIYKSYIFTGNEILFNSPSPTLYDEWQEIPEIWDSLRTYIDTNKEGKFLLTGSSSARKDIVSHTGTGRIGKLRMRTMSLYESKHSSGKISIEKMFSENIEISGESDKTINDIAKYIVCGGWPDKINLDEKKCIKALAFYYTSLINEDVNNIDGVKRNPHIVDSLLKSFSRNIATLSKYSTILEDMRNNNNGIDIKTLDSYINTLERLFVIENIKAWSPKIRSKYAIRTADKKLLVDPSLACISLGIDSEYLLNDYKTFGFLFEALALRDLRIYIEAIDGQIYHYYDQSGLEVDAILSLRNGDWAGIEIKLGSSPDVINGAIKSLKKLESSIDTNFSKKPKFLAVVTGGKFAYKVDGVYVIPLTMLKN